MKLILVTSLFLFAFLRSDAAPSQNFVRKYLFADIYVENGARGAILSVRRLNDDKLIIHFEEQFGKNLSVQDIPNGFRIAGNGRTVNVTVIENRVDYILIKASRNASSAEKISDCADLRTGEVSWYGGPQIFNQYWPIEKLTLVNYSYVPKQQDNVGVAERYWLNSKGAFVLVDDRTPLFVNQNANDKNWLCLSAENRLPYNTRRRSISFDYYVGVGVNAKASHLEAVKRLLKKPNALPDTRMIQHPIWSTWARYKAPINEQIVDKFADEILANRFNNSQLEIDDDWEVCYGGLVFNKTKFPNIKNFTDKLKRKGFRVTLWVHPFINIDCEPYFSEAMKAGWVLPIRVNFAVNFLESISSDT